MLARFVVKMIPGTFRLWALWLLMAVLLSVGHDVVRLGPAALVALRYQHSLVGWEVANLPSKWAHRVVSAFPWNWASEDERRAQVPEYLQLGEQVSRLGSEIERAAALGDESQLAALAALEAELAETKLVRARLRNDVEETLEATIAAVIADEEITTWAGLSIPPVDIRLGQPPMALIASPRDRIEQLHHALVDPNVSVTASESMEDALFDEWDLAGLVTSIGGLATYPTVIDDSLPLKWTLGTAAHEWLHQYLTLLPPGRPFGRLIFTSPEMQTLNETVAEIAGREIGDRAFERLGVIERSPEPATDVPAVESPEDEFDYVIEMRTTRERVDVLLSGGDVEAAEAYMEERRKLFVENGFYIRKLNQAYFAYHGTYATTPQSSSPIGGQLAALRGMMPDLKTFLDVISRVSSYDEFLDVLANERSARPG